MRSTGNSDGSNRIIGFFLLLLWAAPTLLQAAPSQTAITPAGVPPNDPKLNSQWNLKKIGATNFWAVTTGSTNVVVAIVDSGVDYNHEDLRDNMWRNPGETGLDANGNDKATNGIDDDGNGYVDDVYGIDAWDHDSNPMDEGYIIGGELLLYHGTVIAGIIGAVGDCGRDRPRGR